MGEHDPSEAPALRHYLADRDAPCPGCGYNLRGLASDRCPECNNAVRLTVGLVDHGVGSLVAAAVGLGASGAAAAALLGVVVWLSLVEKGFPNGRELVILVLIPGVVACASAAGVVILVLRRVRARFLALRSPARWWIAVGCWGASSAAVATWVGLMIEMM